MRAARAAALVLLAGVLLCAPAAADDAGQWGTCGGLHGPNGKDSQATACPDGFTCVRQDAYYWQCKETKSLGPREKEAVATQATAGNPTPPPPAADGSVPKTADPWGQCGGINGHPEGKDAQWPGLVCPEGFECVRQDMWYYGCKETQKAQPFAPPRTAAVPKPTTPAAAPAPAPTPAPAQPPAEPIEAPKEAPKETPKEEAPKEAPKAPQNSEPGRPLPPQLPEEYISSDQMTLLYKKGANATSDDFARAAEASGATRIKSPEEGAPAKEAPPAEEDAGGQLASAPGAVPAEPAEPVTVDMSFPGVTPDEFKQQFAEGSLKAVAKVAGVDPAEVKAEVRPAGEAPATAPAAGGARRLLQQAAAPAAGVDVTYTIPTTVADRAATLERLELATAKDGAGFAQALAQEGVPLRPAVSIEGTKRVTAGPPAKPAVTPRSGGGIDARKRAIIIGAVVGAVGGALLLAAVVAAIVVAVRRRSADEAGGKAASPRGWGKKAAAPDGDNDIEMVRDKDTGRVKVEPMAPAEAFPRSFPMAGAAPPAVRTTSTKKGAAAAAAAAAAQAVPNSPESFESGEEAFATPRSVGSEGSFKSAKEQTSEASFRTAGGAGASQASAGFASAASAGIASATSGGFASAQSASQSRVTAPTATKSVHSGGGGSGGAGSVATSASRHESAVEFPQAFRPTIGDASDASSEEGSAERLPKLPPSASVAAPPSSSGSGAPLPPTGSSSRASAAGSSRTGSRLGRLGRR